MGNINKIRPGDDSYLQGFPEEVYDLSDTSHLRRFVDALCSDAGVGTLRKIGMLRRLQTSIDETYFNNLDALYGVVFDFPRLSSESYDYNPEMQLVTTDELAEAKIKDAHYRARIWKYASSFAYGGTKRGIKLAAEAGCGKSCHVVEMYDYYQSNGIAEGADISSEVTGVSVDNHLGVYGTADYSEVLVVPLEDITDEERKNIYRAISRLMPQDAIATIVDKDDFFNGTGATFNGDEEYHASFEASSSWWQVIRYVTGAADWSYEYNRASNMWVLPAVKAEAPTQALVNHREDSVDFTFLVSGCVASSEHIGPYSPLLTRVYTSYAEESMQTLQKADYAISPSSTATYTTNYYDLNGVVDWSYIEAYAESYQNLESSRQRRVWSSAEKYPGDNESEWLDVSLERAVPINRIHLRTYRKPETITPYALVDGVWQELKNADGYTLKYRYSSWGGASLAGDMLEVDFEFPIVSTDSFRFEITRGTQLFASVDALGNVSPQEIPFSVEISDASFYYDIYSLSDFRDCTFIDSYGNLVEMGVMKTPPENLAVDGAYWLSQPNVDEDAIEYMICDLGAAQSVDYVELQPIHGGCQMNIYSSVNGVDWEPYPNSYVLYGGAYNLQPRVIRYLKLEFTGLAAVPYTRVGNSHITELKWPNSLLAYYKQLPESVYSQTSVGTYLMDGVDAIQTDSSSVDKFLQLGISNSYGTDLSDFNLNTASVGADNALFTGDEYSMPTSLLSNEYVAQAGLTDASSQVVRENSLEAVRSKSSVFNQNDTLKRRFLSGPHSYRTEVMQRTSDIAYMVGIETIVIGQRGFSTSAQMGTFVVSAADERYISENGGWVEDAGAMWANGGNDVPYLESVDFSVPNAFRSFDFVTKQREPEQQFEYPSDMSKEWHAYAVGGKSSALSTEFGNSGNVLEIVPEDSTATKIGAESDTYLVKAGGVATVQANVYIPGAGTSDGWIFECLDSVDSSQVFSCQKSLACGKWNEFGVTFSPQPSSLWWDSAYAFRVKLDIKAPQNLAQGTPVFFPNIDLTQTYTMVGESGSYQLNIDDIAIVYFNGTENNPVHLDMTGSQEFWFPLQQSLASGESADGVYDAVNNKYYGAYYLYFGNQSTIGTITSPTQKMLDYGKRDDSGNIVLESMVDYTKVFNSVPFYRTADHTELRNQHLSEGVGNVTFMASVPQALANAYNGDGVLHEPSKYKVFDYESDDGRFGIQCYWWGEDLMFRINERDGFCNSCVMGMGGTTLNAVMTPGTTYRAVANWGGRDANGIRKIRMWFHDNSAYGGVSGIDAIELKDIDNVYGLTDGASVVYDEGTY